MTPLFSKYCCIWFCKKEKRKFVFVGGAETGNMIVMSGIDFIIESEEQ
jgi:hypothetical protein